MEAEKLGVLERKTFFDKEDIQHISAAEPYCPQLRKTAIECAKNLGIGISTLARWESQFRNHDGDIPTRGSGNYATDEQKEIARLKRELRDAQDALDVLKKAISILGKN